MQPVRPLRFAVVGAANTLVGLVTIFAAKALLEPGDVVANALGYGVGVLSSFVLNRQWTFQDTGSIGPTMARFLLAFAAAYGLNLASVLLLIEPFQVNSYLAQAFGIIPYTTGFYVLSRYMVFRHGDLGPSRPRAAD
jgi:putative flippase GtrA